MQVLCRTSKEQVETCCSVCGQGFALYWERQTKPQRTQALREIDKVLRGHHSRQAGPQAHPSRGFMVSDWEGPVTFSGAAIVGHAPSWAL